MSRSPDKRANDDYDHHMQKKPDLCLHEKQDMYRVSKNQENFSIIVEVEVSILSDPMSLRAAKVHLTEVVPEVVTDGP